MLRADMDALPITERGERPRGHLGGGRRDARVRPRRPRGHDAGGRRRCWRRCATAGAGGCGSASSPPRRSPAGAVPMIGDGALDGVDQVLGIHLWAPLQVGHGWCQDWPDLRQRRRVRAHRPRPRWPRRHAPHQHRPGGRRGAGGGGACRASSAARRRPSRPRWSPSAASRAARAFNVIADEVRLRGTVRAIDPDERERLLRRVAEVAAAIASASGASAEFERAAGCPPVISDAESVDDRAPRRRSPPSARTTW